MKKIEIKTIKRNFKEEHQIPEYSNKIVKVEQLISPSAFSNYSEYYYNDKGICYKFKSDDMIKKYKYNSDNQLIKTYLNNTLFHDIQYTEHGMFIKEHKLKNGYDEFIKYVDEKGRLIYDKYGSLYRSIVYDIYDRIIAINTNYYDGDEIKLNNIIINYINNDLDDRVDSYIIDGLLYLNDDIRLTNDMIEIGTNNDILQKAKKCYEKTLELVNEFENDNIYREVYIDGRLIALIENEYDIYLDNELVYDSNNNNNIKLYITLEKDNYIRLEYKNNHEVITTYKISIVDNNEER